MPCTVISGIIVIERGGHVTRRNQKINSQKDTHPPDLHFATFHKWWNLPVDSILYLGPFWSLTKTRVYCCLYHLKEFYFGFHVWNLHYFCKICLRMAGLCIFERLHFLGVFSSKLAQEYTCNMWPKIYWGLHLFILLNNFLTLCGFS